jgi:hypothetical protein
LLKKRDAAPDPCNGTEYTTASLNGRRGFDQLWRRDAVINRLDGLAAVQRPRAHGASDEKQRDRCGPIPAYRADDIPSVAREGCGAAR